MTNQEFSTMAMAGFFIALIILYGIMHFMLYKNNRPVSAVFGFRNFVEFFKLMIEKKSKLQYAPIPILLILCIALTPYFFTKTLPIEREGDCSFQRRFEKSEIKELITSKFVDKANHATLSFWVMDHDSSSNVYGLNYHWDEIYENAQPGDSLIKHKNSKVVTLRRNQIDLNFSIDYGCKK